MFERVKDWDKAALAAIEGHLAKPFEWGVSDCSIMAADVVQAVTGEDVLPVRTWTDEATAHAELRARGGLEAAVDAVLPEVPVMMAQRFDIGLWRQGMISALVVCSGNGFIGKTVDGRLNVPRSVIVKAWATGR